MACPDLGTLSTFSSLTLLLKFSLDASLPRHLCFPSPLSPTPFFYMTRANVKSQVIFYLSKWYTKRELSLRMALFYNGSLIAGAFGNLIAAGILGGLDGVQGIAAWRWLYILEGVVTVATGIVIVFVLPDFPESWKRLSPEMRRVAARRLALDASGSDVDESGGAKTQVDGLKLALKDPKVWILTIAYHAFIGAGGFQNFFPTLTRTLGFDDTVSLLLVAPPYLFMAFYCGFHSWLSDRVQNRFWFFMCKHCPSLCNDEAFIDIDEQTPFPSSSLAA